MAQQRKRAVTETFVQPPVLLLWWRGVLECDSLKSFWVSVIMSKRWPLWYPERRASSGSCAVAIITAALTTVTEAAAWCHTQCEHCSFHCFEDRISLLLQHSNIILAWLCNSVPIESLERLKGSSQVSFLTTLDTSRRRHWAPFCPRSIIRTLFTLLILLPL